MIRIKILFFFGLMALIGCSNERNERYALRDDIATKYNALSDKDIDGYVYELQDKILKGNKPLCVIGSVQEISKKDTGYLIQMKLRKSEEKKYYLAQLKVSDELFRKLNEQMKVSKHKYGVFVFHINAINSGGGKETKEDENGDSYDYDVTAVIFKGELIDFSIFNKK